MYYRLHSCVKAILIIISITLAGNTMTAQLTSLAWVKSLGGSGDCSALSITHDASGNIYTTGYFTGTADFNPGPAVYNLTAAGIRDIFITKMDSLGNLLWVRTIGGVNHDVGVSIKVDALGNAYIAGYFQGTVDFDPGPLVHYLTAGILGNDLFLMKLDVSGGLVWCKSMGGASSETCNSMCLDLSGNIYITGYYWGTADFDPGTGVSSLTAKGTYDAFISKFNNSGNLVWARSIGGNGADEPFSIAVDQAGNVYTTGHFDSTADFDPGLAVHNVTPVGALDAFVCKLDASGNFAWVKMFTGVQSELSYSIALDATGNIYTAGQFYGTTDFDPGTGTHLLTAQFSDIFICKLSASGNLLWAKKAGTANDDKGAGIAIDVAGYVYVTGWSRVLSTPNVFIHKLDASGNAVWSNTFTGPGIPEPTSYGYSLSVDLWGSVYTTGIFKGTMDFDPDLGTYHLSSAGSGFGTYIHKMRQCEDVNATLATSSNVSCYGGSDGSATVAVTGGTSFTYSWAPSGGSSATATGLKAGTYVCTITNACGDTAMKTVTVTEPLIAINTSVSLSDKKLTAHQLNASYQWLNCGTASLIPGATGPSYTAPAHGIYAVIITIASCSDTSDCINTNPAGINPVTADNATLTYPNPSNGIFTVESAESGHLIIFDALGREVKNQRLNKGKNIIDLSDASNGVYTLRVITSGQRKSLKMVISK